MQHFGYMLLVYVMSSYWSCVVCIFLYALMINVVIAIVIDTHLFAGTDQNDQQYQDKVEKRLLED